MEESTSRKKRKRSTIACVECHTRKVRCNAATQGTPCSNCFEDGVECRIYRRADSFQNANDDETRGSLRQLATMAEKRRKTSMHSETRPMNEISPISNVESGGSKRLPPSLAHEPSGEMGTTGPYPSEQQPGYDQAESPVTTLNSKPFYAGESQGLEFLFDTCCPDRPIKGCHYVVPAHSYRAKRLPRKMSVPSHRLPSLDLQHELIRCFFHFVWPMLPIVDVHGFLSAYVHDARSISRLLLWSIFFAGANYIDKDILKRHHIPSRKFLKEQCYQIAKEIHESQLEDDKTVLIQSATMLAFWYIDFDDRDGSTHWLGVAINLAFTIGLHRKDSYESIAPRPFPEVTRRLWKCLWWSILYREAWAAMAAGRPMRVDSQDSDVLMPDVTEAPKDEVEDLPPAAKRFVPPSLSRMPDIWLCLLDLSLLVEHILKSYYRPRSLPPSSRQLDYDGSRILECRERLERMEPFHCSYARLQFLHVMAYHYTLLIVLYRPCMAIMLEDADRFPREFQHDVVAKARKSADDLTGVINELISTGMLGQSPTTLVTAVMTAMQIYMWDIRFATGLSKNYASHQLDLHLMVLSHLAETYWTADMQHSLFTIMLKMVKESAVSEVGAVRRPSQSQSDKPAAGQPNDSALPSSNWMSDSLDDFLRSFNPFVGLPMPEAELSTSLDWSIDDSPPLTS